MSLTKVTYSMTSGAPINVKDFGAVGDGITNDTAAIQAAIAAANSGDTILIDGIYLVTGLTINKRVDIRGINSGGDASGTTGSGFKSVSNAAILNYSTTASRFCLLENINILGLVTAGTNQHGIYIDNAGMRIENCTIRACGGSGIYVKNSYAGAYSNTYISLCKSHGVTFDTNAGANVWVGVAVAGCEGNGFNLDSLDGMDNFFGCIAEQNDGYGIYFGDGVVGNQFYNGYTERNVLGTVLFDTNSDYNAVHLSSYSDSTSEPIPVNNGGIGNTVSGKRYLEPTRYRFSKSVGIGDTGINPATNLHVADSLNNGNIALFQNKSATSPQNLLLEYTGVSGGTGGPFLDCFDDARRLVILGNGNVQNVSGSYTAISDAKLKENIVDATPKLDDLIKVRVVNYALKAEPNRKYLGVIAQELENIFPALVEETVDKKTNETYKSVKYSIFIPMLIKAIQELKTEFDEYKLTHL